MATSEARRRWGRIGGLTAWSRHDADTMLGPARRGFAARWEHLVDPDLRLDPAERTRRAERARQAHIPVYSVLLGTPDGVIDVPLPGGFQAQMRVPPSPETLRTISQVTGGRFFTAPSAAELRQVYERLGSRLGSRKQSREVTDLFAGGSAALLLIGGGLSALWFRRVP
jgi:Ca-activated chloride channel family protein